MGHWLADAEAAARAQAQGGWLRRFDPRYWTVDFPRPMMAGVVTTAVDALRVEALFYNRDDLAGLIWEAEDRRDHPLLRYETARDFRGVTLRFRWRSRGLKPLDAVHGPTLTLEGRDPEGRARAWYVRLWNYARGTPEDAEIRLDFAALAAGWTPGEGEGAYAGDLDRIMVSLAAPGYDAKPGRLAAPAEAWLELSGLRCDGPGAVLARGDAWLPPHGAGIATGYDDGYNQTPARLIGQIEALGYRGAICHYIGMSHYFRLRPDGVALRADEAAPVLNGPCRMWHADLLRRAAAAGLEVILSLSYEMLEAHCWEAWKQRFADGSPALTGWQPPSALLSPAHPGAMAYLQAVARALASLAVAAGVPVRVQIGEPWWWVRADGAIALHDAAARAVLGREAATVTQVRGAPPAAALAVLDRAGALLAASTAALRDAVKAVAPEAETLLLVYLPTLLDPATPEARRANLPAAWARPAFDRLQLEDYAWVTAGAAGASARGAEEAGARLGYPPERQDYLAGFVADAEAAAAAWPRIEAAAAAARARGVARLFVWALPQVARDGFTRFGEEEGAMDAFDEVDFPLALGREAQVAPGFSTSIVTSAAGHEQRNSAWAEARLRFDAGPGVRSEADMARLLAFFRARRGAARGFRFRDPFDSSSAADNGVPSPTDQRLGLGDGQRTDFPLLKLYGEGDPQGRRITRPVAGSVRVSLDGVERLAGWQLAPGGLIRFAAPPAPGAIVRAGYRFDVPVRFAEDRLEVNRAAFGAGIATSVPLVELREA
ncbi:DUF2460 domain-containing protein [Sphingomonas morindae]|uniref:DUF2460 domain-containing protein n=1 Tax=Sphingomonas morindae TaxID=1541170 RepID=A0ABY4X3P4_9SPHN|nr:DUF2460 domain-containing protein [Sphingomonas morindae]USI71476.1 DUF2460 domain-containing protein [Sphingomonas morindae]